MISYLKGTCLEILADGTAIIETNGLGFGVRLKETIQSGQKISLYIHEHIREDSFDLYGFSHHDDLTVFKQVLSINGVGPKLALSILKHGSTEQLMIALTENNVAYFQSISGVGKKLAQKIILELKGKVGQESRLADIIDDRFNEVKEVLANLGYKPFEYNKILPQIPKDLITTQQQVTWALRQLGQRSSQ